MTLDEWISKHAKDLEKDISIDIANNDDPVRGVMTLIRQWIDNGCTCANTTVGITASGSGCACGGCGRKRTNGDRVPPKAKRRYEDG